LQHSGSELNITDAGPGNTAGIVQSWAVQDFGCWYR
jgi:hypothetical protein